MKKNKFWICIISLAMQLPLTQFSLAQESVLDVGIRIQKTVNLYYENGFSVQYSDKRLKPDRLYFGFTYVTSRLGTALNSNAIPQDNFLFSGAWYFRPNHVLRPLVRLNSGFFVANYEEEVFNELPNSSFLLSPDIGVIFETTLPLKISLSLGYNLITGDGESGPGTLYPLYFQSTISWNLIKK